MIGLVTGASEGLGLELIKVGLENGHKMVATWLGIPGEDTKLLALKERYDRQLVIIKMDVTNMEEVKLCAEEFSKQSDHLDFIVNSAGVLFESRFETIDPISEVNIDMLRKTIDVNTVGPAIVLKAFVPFIYNAKEPCIINITSEAGHLSPEGHVYMAYSISKHGANMYTQKIRNYLVATEDKAHVRIFMLHPGRMETVMGKENAQILPSESALGIYDIIEKRTNPQLDIPFINYKGEQMPY